MINLEDLENTEDELNCWLALNIMGWEQFTVDKNIFEEQLDCNLWIYGGSYNCHMLIGNGDYCIKPFNDCSGNPIGTDLHACMSTNVENLENNRLGNHVISYNAWKPTQNHKQAHQVVTTLMENHKKLIKVTNLRVMQRNILNNLVCDHLHDDYIQCGERELFRAISATPLQKMIAIYEAMKLECV